MKSQNALFIIIDDYKCYLFLYLNKPTFTFTHDTHET